MAKRPKLQRFVSSVDMSAFFSMKIAVMARDENAAETLVQNHLDAIGKLADHMVTYLIDPHSEAVKSYIEGMDARGAGLPKCLKVAGVGVSLDDNDGNPEVLETEQEDE